MKISRLAILWILACVLILELSCATDEDGPTSPDDTYTPTCHDSITALVIIDSPQSTGGIMTTADRVLFGWRSYRDWDPAFVRYLWSENTDTNGIYDPTFDLVRDLNENTWRYEDRWSPWIDFGTSGDSGTTCLLGDDEDLVTNHLHIFAVQAMDSCGIIGEEFEQDINVRRFIVSAEACPLLFVGELYLGIYIFIGKDLQPHQFQLPPGIPLNFRWMGDAKGYGSEIVGYRYGWDVQDLEKPEDWAVSWSPHHLQAPERRIHSGSHTFYIETMDFSSNITRASILIEVIPFTMERNLLWVDDFFSTDPQPPLYEMPGETNHDDFWDHICRKAAGFIPERDVYDCVYGHNFHPPDIETLGRYRNIIWTYSSTSDSWSDLIRFTPESFIGQILPQQINYFPLFLQKCGHLWTLGRADRRGGLAAAFPELIPITFPASFKYDMWPGDTSGVNSMPYRDYCVSVVDKIVGTLRTGEGMPYRSVPKYDAMRFAYRDDTDPVTAAHPGFPSRLDLWEEVTRPGRYFDPNAPGQYPGGLTYVEIYDPEYWMYYNHYDSRNCFHPMYRMRSCNSRSALDNTTVVLWVTTYADLDPSNCNGGSPAPSVHLGFPLWFFDRAQVDSLAQAIFSEWGILAE